MTWPTSASIARAVSMNRYGVGPLTGAAGAPAGGTFAGKTLMWQLGVGSWELGSFGSWDLGAGIWGHVGVGSWELGVGSWGHVQLGLAAAAAATFDRES